MLKSAFAVLFVALLAATFDARAETASPLPEWAPRLLGAQFTGIYQHLYPFDSPYSGRNSLQASGDNGFTHTYGIYFGSQVTQRLQAYLDVEMARGHGISNATGLGGNTNGDVIRQGTANLGQEPYLARAFLRYVIPLSGEKEAKERSQDQLAVQEATRRFEIKFGKMALPDDFDLNRYANNTRTQFLNWGLFNNTAWDYAADTRGYSNGILFAYIAPDWALRLGSYQMPTQANGNVLDGDLLKARGDNLEFTLGSETVIRFLAYQNQGRLGDYTDALIVARVSGSVPDITHDDRRGRRKYGFGVNLEQPLADEGETGMFMRLGWNDGRTESFAFTEVDRHASLGAQVSGVHWNRGADRLGIAYLFHALSSPHRNYLAAGGSGFLLGDGQLNYGYEQIAEAYYRVQFGRYVQLSPDFQYIRNPGYNRDRGPAKAISLRLRLNY
jgi:high affinity Mn2+ porin